MRKNVFFLLLLLLLLLTLSGCGDSIAPETEKVSLTALQYELENQTLDFDNMWFFQQIEEQTGVHVDFDVVKHSDWTNRVNLMFASGRYHDLILRGSLDVEDYGVTQHVILPLDDYLEEYIREHKLSEYLTLIKESKKVCPIPIIASINCYTDSEWIEFAKMIEEAGADALEINILALQSEVQYTYGSFEQRHIDILRHIKKTIKIPVIMKLGDNLTNPVALIDQLYANGAAAVVLFNRFYQPDINIEKMEHISGEIFSNASDLAIPLRWIGITSAVVDKIDYAASGGVANAESVVKAILAGASAVEVCSAVYLNTNAFIGEANRFLSAWMERKGFRNIAQFKGKLNIKDVQGVNTFERTQFLKYFGKKE